MGFGQQIYEPKVITEYSTVEKYIKVPVEVIKKEPIEVVRRIPVEKELRDFRSAEEFLAKIEEYSSGITYLGGSCIDSARLFVDIARKDGYYLDTEIVQGGWHMVVKAFANGQIWCYDPRLRRAWVAYSKMGKSIEIEGVQ